MALDVGQSAKLITPVIQGTVADVRYNKEAKTMEYLLEWTDADGDIHQRWFNESDLEVINAA